MKRIILAIGLFAISGLTLADQYVRPYVRKDGTYVEGHMRSSPNSTRTDNWSSQGNVNPYTGQKGYEDPYKPQTPPSTYGTQPQRNRGY